MSTLAQVKFMPSGLVARKLRLSPRSLGRIAGTVPLVAGDERVDVGLNVRHGAKNLRVADAVAPGPDGQGWTYSPSLLAILQQYQVRSCSMPCMPTVRGNDIFARLGRLFKQRQPVRTSLAGLQDQSCHGLCRVSWVCVPAACQSGLMSTSLVTY